MVMESLFGIVDVFCVSRLGATAVPTLGYTESLLTIPFGDATGLSTSTTAFVAGRIAEKDPEGASETAVQAHRSWVISAGCIRGDRSGRGTAGNA